MYLLPLYINRCQSPVSSRDRYEQASNCELCETRRVVRDCIREAIYNWQSVPANTRVLHLPARAPALGMHAFAHFPLGCSSSRSWPSFSGSCNVGHTERRFTWSVWELACLLLLPLWYEILALFAFSPALCANIYCQGVYFPLSAGHCRLEGWTNVPGRMQPTDRHTTYKH